MTDLNFSIVNIPIDAMPLNVAIYRYVEKEGDFIFVNFNKMAEKTEQIERKELLGKHLCKVFPKVKEFGLFDILLSVYKNGGYKEFDLSFYEDHRVSGWRHNVISKLDNGDVIVLYSDLTMLKRYESEESKRHERTKAFKSALLEWARIDYNKTEDAIKEATKILSHTLNIDRSSVWLYNNDKTMLDCVSLYILNEKKHYKLESFEVSKYPKYIEAVELGCPMVIEDAKSDSRSSEFADSYLKPSNINSMLDIPIIHQGQVIGVVCNEHTGSSKVWSTEEEEFAVAIASNISLVLEIQKRLNVESKLQSLGNIIDNSMNEVYIFDRESFKFTYVNSEVQRNLGYTLQEMQHMTPVDIKPDHNMQSFMLLMEPLINGTKEFLIFETAHQRKDGSIYDVEIRLELMNMDNTKQFVVIAHDISERKHVQNELQNSEEKFRNIAENASMGIFIYQETYVYINQAFIDMSGYSAKEIYNMQAWDLVEDQFKPKTKEIALRRLAGESFPQEYIDIKVVRKNGNIRTMRLSTQTIKYNGGYAGMGTIVDITDIKETKQKLQLLARAVEQMGELVRITDRDGVITYVNDALVAHSGYTHVELIGKNTSIFKSGKHDKSFYENLWETILAAKTYKGVFINRKKDKQIYYEEETITPMLDSEGNIQYFVATSSDITERARMEEELHKLATQDSLTGIFNRYKTNEEIDIEITRAKRYNGTFALAMLDIDHFKVVNDTYGHDVGDFVLKEFTDIVKAHIRESDRFGRWGGEEFMIILPELDKEQAVKFANKLLRRVEEHHFKDMPKITVSIGITLYNEDDTKESLIKRVDDALYIAKEAGRNCVKIN